jgi:hypothetical protein
LEECGWIIVFSFFRLRRSILDDYDGGDLKLRWWRP